MANRIPEELRQHAAYLRSCNDDVADYEADLVDELADALEARDTAQADIDNCKQILAADMTEPKHEALPPPSRPIPVGTIAFCLYDVIQELRRLRGDVTSGRIAQDYLAQERDLLRAKINTEFSHQDRGIRTNPPFASKEAMPLDEAESSGRTVVERLSMAGRALSAEAERDLLRATLAAVRERARDWAQSAEHWRHNRGQRGRMKLGYEVLDSVASELLALLDGTAPEEGK